MATVSTFGTLLADRQVVQFMLANCASELYIARLMLLHIAYKAEKAWTSARRTLSPRSVSLIWSPW